MPISLYVLLLNTALTDNELFLTYPAKSRTFGSDTIYRIGDELKVGFEQIAYTATISLKRNR